MQDEMNYIDECQMTQTEIFDKEAQDAKFLPWIIGVYSREIS